MGRVEWSLMAGDDVETVVSMLLCSEMPSAQRVRPAQGDGGIDIFVAGDDGPTVSRAIYQVKKFAANLTNSQKRQITKSFNRVLDTSNNEGWAITQWHLVCPLTPTPGNLNWFVGLTENAGFPCYWLDLDRLNMLASKYPALIDWYLHDGKQRLDNAITALAAIITGQRKRESEQPLTPSDVLPELVGIYDSINAHDPHYRYAVEISHLQPDATAAQSPGLVALSATRTESAWVITKIFARSLAALEERPVPLELQLTVDSDHPDYEELTDQFQRFIDYGAPLTMPRGTVTGIIDLPAGLGGNFSDTDLSLTPVTHRQSSPSAVANDEVLLAILDPTGRDVRTELRIHAVEHTHGSVGHRTVWHDKSELIVVETRTRPKDGHLDIMVELRGADFTGRRPEDLVEPFEFYSILHQPNRFGLRPVYGPRRFEDTPTIPNDEDQHLVALAQLVRMLVTIQDHVPQRLLWPARLTRDEITEIMTAAKLLSGQLVPVHSQDLYIKLDEPTDLAVGGEYEFCDVYEFAIHLDGQRIPVGHCAAVVQGRIVALNDSFAAIEPAEPSSVLGLFTSSDVAVSQVFFRGRHVGHNVAS
ncbi:MAG: hypothetical protein JWN03_3097 [Nocardia sp.]|uniref:hypothetical protein n=1 Tax=Nocardia sp. TaxID=1821 RepID=UPI00261038D0|nr:hypothetical protein [Nocardia sp.]MCU1642822.1 hypothetical protein [Nocardia sp.]